MELNFDVNEDSTIETLPKLKEQIEFEGDDDYFVRLRKEAQSARSKKSMAPEERASFKQQRGGQQSCFSSFGSQNDRDREELNKFFDSDRNFIILSNAGKPIYSLHGDIYNLSSIYATLYAMISKIQTFQFKPIDITIHAIKDEEDDEPQMQILQTEEFKQEINRYRLDSNASFNDRNMSLYQFGSNAGLADSMIQQREIKHLEENNFKAWKLENLQKKPLFSAIHS